VRVVGLHLDHLAQVRLEDVELVDALRGHRAVVEELEGLGMLGHRLVEEVVGVPPGARVAQQLRLDLDHLDAVLGGARLDLRRYSRPASSPCWRAMRVAILSCARTQSPASTFWYQPIASS
jgi:hypothetical protein